MRILQVTSLFSPDRVGGAEIFVEDLARGLADKGHTVAVAAISREDQAAQQRDGFTIHRLGHTTPFFIGDWGNNRNGSENIIRSPCNWIRASFVGLRVSSMISGRTWSIPIRYRN